MPPVSIPDRPFTSDGLDELGLSRAMLRRGLKSGRLRRIVRGVYVSAHVPDSFDLRVAAVALVVADGHVVVDRTAAWLHGFNAYTPAEHELGPVVETCALRGHQPADRVGVDGRTRDLTADDILVVGGVRVTTPMRTALDLACHLRRREAFAALNGLAREHGFTSAELHRLLPRFRRRRGVVQARKLVPLVDPRLESPRESWTLLAILDAGLPPPTPQHWIEIDGVRTYRLDFAYVHLRVCVEYDGWEAHEQSEEQRRYDEERRAWLRANGWTVIVVRLGDFTGDALDRWIGELRAALCPSYSPRRW
ncbi:type IV toxin-antitoxin system AbiEi family antitoxin domain-containing protein [Nocardioides cheoyonin]|uniref:type IV toxin-antitoxin system AbiEi family antitoxin domain-containing protein n=1 Tax=Nocardioides cheoyonin TaxID=3156615 RepID=UPI0032B444A1